MEELLYEDNKYYIYLEDRYVSIYYKSTMDYIKFKIKNIFNNCKSYLNKQSVHCINFIARINNIID